MGFRKGLLVAVLTAAALGEKNGLSPLFDQDIHTEEIRASAIDEFEKSFLALAYKNFSSVNKDIAVDIFLRGDNNVYYDTLSSFARASVGSASGSSILVPEQSFDDFWNDFIDYWENRSITSGPISVEAVMINLGYTPLGQPRRYAGIVINFSKDGVSSIEYREKQNIPQDWQDAIRESLDPVQEIPVTPPQ